MTTIDERSVTKLKFYRHVSIQLTKCLKKQTTEPMVVLITTNKIKLDINTKQMNTDRSRGYFKSIPEGNRRLPGIAAKRRPDDCPAQKKRFTYNRHRVTKTHIKTVHKKSASSAKICTPFGSPGSGFESACRTDDPDSAAVKLTQKSTNKVVSIFSNIWAHVYSSMGHNVNTLRFNRTF